MCSARCTSQRHSGDLPPAEEALFDAAMANPDFKNVHESVQHPDAEGPAHIHHVPLVGGAWEADGNGRGAEKHYQKIKIPFYTGSGAYAYTYKLHWLGGAALFPKRQGAIEIAIHRGLLISRGRFINITMKSFAGTIIG